MVALQKPAALRTPGDGPRGTQKGWKVLWWFPSHTPQWGQLEQEWEPLLCVTQSRHTTSAKWHGGRVAWIYSSSLWDTEKRWLTQQGLTEHTFNEGTFHRYTKRVKGINKGWGGSQGSTTIGRKVFPPLGLKGEGGKAVSLEPVGAGALGEAPPDRGVGGTEGQPSRKTLGIGWQACRGRWGWGKQPAKRGRWLLRGHNLRP